MPDWTFREEAVRPESPTLGNALRTFLETRHHMAIVQDDFGGTSGLVTPEDVMQILLGVEIVDESDCVADLRALATQIRDQRVVRRSQHQE